MVGEGGQLGHGPHFFLNLLYRLICKKKIGPKPFSQVLYVFVPTPIPHFLARPDGCNNLHVNIINPCSSINFHIHITLAVVQARILVMDAETCVFESVNDKLLNQYIYHVSRYYMSNRPATKTVSSLRIR